MTDKLELISLKGRGRAEAVRLMLTYAEHPFTDTRLTIAEWKLRKKKDGYSEDSKLPVLLVNDRTRIIGVNEISKYVAEKNELYGDLPGEQKAIDEVIKSLEELHIGLAPIVRATLTKNYEERRTVWNEFKESALTPCLKRFEEELKEKMFLVGTKVPPFPS
ncbi:glutathione S-transferase protein [Oesophagostomum dentatum]|uniref:Glutathione S-transferase protein n=1 Tax=Oesophagostomum dentatum TaxID=61180 RepID=A0A0B1TIQ7_OESDE|nr:glutathione S-transferase protein [Oesophagostomum dentatum]